jgi:hypothetical protein
MMPAEARDRVKRARILAGAAALVGGLALYALAAVELAGRVVPDEWAAQALFYAVAGVLWVVPAARLTRWMQAAPGPDAGRREGATSRTAGAGIAAPRSGRSP